MRGKFTFPISAGVINVALLLKFMLPPVSTSPLYVISELAPRVDFAVKVVKRLRIIFVVRFVPSLIVAVGGSHSVIDLPIPDQLIVAIPSMSNSNPASFTTHSSILYPNCRVKVIFVSSAILSSRPVTVIAVAVSYTHLTLPTKLLV